MKKFYILCLKLIGELIYHKIWKYVDGCSVNEVLPQPVGFVRVSRSRARTNQKRQDQKLALIGLTQHPVLARCFCWGVSPRNLASGV